MRKTGKAKTLLTMLLAAAALQAGTAFGAQATGESQLQAGTWVKEAEGWKFRKPSGEMATGWIQNCKRLVLPAARERTYGNWHAAHE